MGHPPSPQPDALDSQELPPPPLLKFSSSSSTLRSLPPAWRLESVTLGSVAPPPPKLRSTSTPSSAALRSGLALPSPLFRMTSVPVRSMARPQAAAEAPAAAPEPLGDYEDGLPLHRDVWLHVLTFLASPCPEYPAVSRAFRAAHAKSPNAVIASTLHALDPDTAKVLVPKLAALDPAEIEAACARHSALVARLGHQPSPGDAYQKYLRWCQDVPAAAPEVLRIIVGTSMLPQDTLTNCCPLLQGSDVAGRDCSTQLLAACTVLENHNCALHGNSPGFGSESDVDWAWPQVHQEMRWPFCTIADVHRAFDLERYFTLLEWIAQDHGRLRQMMAEFEGVQVRGGFHEALSKFARFDVAVAFETYDNDFAGAVSCLVGTDRMVGAFVSLVALANLCDEFRMWAAS